ncbi:hypothetical protein ABZ297_14770 [Nonomuraea sp. NPDC005983]|uniref:hypothetical protein n=1 Tax=Nonomuraea sp. NPDC005983 TaxID=3155595 RepID=UPI0033A96998
MKFRLMLAGLAPVLAMTLAACGSKPADDGIASAGGGTAKPTASASPSLDPQEARLKFAQCMREHGVDMPDPDSSGRVTIKGKKGDPDPSKAMQACQHFMKDAVGNKMGGPMDPAQRDRMVKFAACMREHGVDMPDPGPNGEFRAKIGKGGEQKMKAAEEACKEFAPGFGKKQP